MKHWASLRHDREGAKVALTPAERQVLIDLEAGDQPKEIAARTGRSVHTVRTLIQRAIQKLGCGGRTEALAVARRSGMFTQSL
jgi:DNA-binding CsgD family transcriptional regulator